MRIIATLLIIFTLFAYRSYGQESIRIGLTITSESNERFDGLVFGTDPKATMGGDAELGEEEYPGFPGFPPKQLHAFIIIVDPQTNEEYYSYKNFKPFPKGQDKYYTTFKLEINPYSGDTITVRWGALPGFIDSAYFVKPYAGSDLFSINMKDNPSYSFNIRNFGIPMKALFKVWFTRNPSGVEESAEEIKTIALYPNPASDVLTLPNVPVRSNYTIYNIVGRAVSKGVLKGGMNQINIQNFQTGCYYINIADNNGNQQNRSFLKK